MRHSRIVGTGSYLPARSVSNAEVTRRLRLSEAEVLRLTGIQARHWAAEDQTTSHLAEQAARQALGAAGMGPESVDAILVSTTSPDMVFPSTACHLQRRLGANRVAAFDVAASCSGFLYGLSMADAMIRNGQSRRCLVVAAEIKSRFLDLNDENTAVIFGDGAGAAVVVGEEGRPERNAHREAGILGIRLGADGSRHDLITVPAGGSRQPATPQTLQEGLHVLRMQGGPLFRIAVKRLAEAVADILKEFGCRVEDLGQAIFHQANARLLAALRRKVGLAPDQTYTVIERFGNTSSASLPIALDYAVREERLKPGDLVLLGTFGGGLTWATALLRW